MKYFKLSKTSWIILAVGVFVVVLAGLGITRSQQLSEQEQLDEELSFSQASLNNLHIDLLQLQLDELEQMAETEQLQLEQAVDLLDRTVVSVDITDEFFAIAGRCGVIVINFNTSPISTSLYAGLGLATTSVNAAVDVKWPT
jgi:hypothetical protein